MNWNIKKIATLAMLTAIAFVSTALFPKIALFPSAPYLTLDPKDIVLAITGLIFGPIEAIVVTVVVCLIEMFTISNSGAIGCLMNVLASLAFVLPPALIYKKWHKIGGAVVGLVVSVIAMTVVMVLWNIIITPLYTQIPNMTTQQVRSMVIGMLATVFIPFNLIKSALNAVFTMMLYKPIIIALRKTHLVPESENSEKANKTNVIIVYAISGVMALSLIIVVFLLAKG